MSRDFYVFALNFISKFYATWGYLGGMSIARAVFDGDLKGASEMAVGPPQYRREERRPDCWPDWPDEVEDPAVIAALAQKNAPAMVFGDIMRLLGMTFIVITIIDLSLKVFYLQ